MPTTEETRALVLAAFKAIDTVHGEFYAGAEDKRRLQAPLLPFAEHFSDLGLVACPHCRTLMEKDSWLLDVDAPGRCYYCEDET